MQASSHRTTPAVNKKNLHQVVDHFLEQGRGRIAIEQDGRSCSYDELDVLSGALGALLKDAGVGRGDVVALPMAASINYVAAMLAVVRCGAIFMPVDPAFPEARLRTMLAAARPRAVLGDEPAVVDRIASFGAHAACLLIGQGVPPASAAARAPLVAGDDDTGYLISTSGSTGEPKLIAGRNKGISHFVHWEVSEFGIDEGVRASFFAPPTFDVSLREIFVPLLAGGTLVIPAADVRGDARRLAAWLRERSITLMHCVPSLLRLLTRALADGGVPTSRSALPALRLVALAGEPLYGADVRAWRAQTGAGMQLVNLYGPSETTLAKAFFRIGDDVAPNAIVPLGQPINNTALLILREGRLCDIGEIGELHIHTPFASNGYWHNPELSAQAFIANPLAPESGEKIYRTGDLGRYRADRGVEFVGRADRQVKVNGVRIELPEIESAMRACPEVTEAVAHTFRRPDGETVLVGYYSADGTLDAQALRATMQQSLPDSMLPGYLLQLPEFPRNLNGKIDRRALPRPESLLNLDHGYTAPQGELEEQIAGLWAEALGLDKVGATSPYLHIGGNSLRAIGLIGRIGQRFGVNITIRDFFESGTVRALAARIAAGSSPANAAIPAAAPQASYPLTDAQAGLWLLDQIDQARSLYNNVEWLELHGPLDSVALRAAFASLIERHPSLRTAFVAIDGLPRQRVLPAPAFTLHEETDGGNGPERVLAMLAEERQRHFDLAAGQLMHVRLLRQSATCHHLIINMHHIACDGWSMGILVRELCDHYHAAQAGQLSVATAPQLHMGDVASWLATAPDTETRAEQWRARLADAEKRAVLPADADSGADPLAAASVELVLSGASSAALRERLARLNATPFMAVAAALSILLYRHGGSETVVIGTPLAGRSRAELAGVVGFMVNTLPLALRLSPEITFAALLDRTRQAVEQLSEAEFDSPGKWVAGQRAAADPATNPFYDVVLAMEPAAAAMTLAGLEVIERTVPDAPARNDLSLRLQDDGASLTLIAEYRTALYRETTMRAMLAQLERVLWNGSEQADLPLKRLSMLDPSQAAALLHSAQGPRQALPQLSIDQAFALQVLRAPDAIALATFESRSSYRWLDQRANLIAATLRAQHGVKPGDVVAVLLEREADWPAAILGVLKAGAIYLPLDTWHPAGRHAELLDDAGALVLISRAPLAQAVAGHAALLDLDLDFDLAPGVSEAAIASSAMPDAPAYLIYTSGSTGTPKGVLVSHRAFLNMITDQIDALDMVSADCVLQFVSPAFDVSLFEVFLALLSGASLGLAERRQCNSVDGYTNALSTLGVTISALTPGFLNSLGDVPLSGLRMIISGGETPIAADVARRLAQGIRYINAYGPTEAAVCAAFHEFSPQAMAQPIPIGRPTANTALHVVAPDLTPLPDGAIGELAISGAGLAIEYYRRPSATELAFVEHTLAAGAQRLYRSGDRVRRQSDGSLVFVGRADSQVKIRGHRVEIGEVEAALRQQAGVGDARVLARTVGQDTELVAYWSGEPDAADGLRQSLAQRLPDYMLPRVILRLDALPLNVNGKLDRSRLPELDTGAASERDEPRNAQEAHLCAIWSELLGRERSGRDDDFFNLGGRSLAANRLALRAARALGVKVDLRDVYAAPTPALLAQLLSGRAGATDVLPSLPMAQTAPLSPMQRRLWVIDQLGQSGATYHICGLTRLTGTLDAEALRTAFDDVVARQAVLRTRFVTDNGEPVQLTDPAGPLAWSALPSGLAPDALQAALEQIAATPFDLGCDWPIRIALANSGDGQWDLLIVLHHIAADGWSMPILETELTEAYRARLAGAAPQWTALPAQYRDVSAWLVQQLEQDAYAGERAYWLDRLAAPLALLDLPADRARPAVRRFRGTTVDHVLGTAAVQAARDCARIHGVTLFTTMLAGLQTLLYRLSGQTDITIGVPVAGRQHPASEALVGFFVNTLALREQIDGSAGFGQRLGAAAASMQQGLLNQNYPFDRLVGELNIARDTSRSALYDVMIGFDEASAAPAFAGLTAQPGRLARSGARCDMSWMFDFGGPAPTLSVEFDTDLFDASRIADWVRRFEHLLCAAAAAPELPLDRLDLLLGDERAALVRNAAAPHAPDAPAPDTSVIGLFERCAAAHEEAPALITDASVWSYGQLNEAANRLARALQPRVGAGTAPVALMAERGALMVVAQLAILKCGLPYLPIEPDAPAERIALLLADSGARILLCDPAVSAPAALGQATLMALVVPSDTSGANLDLATGADDPIYVMYTSGSTGRPKGVAARNRGVVRLVQHGLYYTPERGDRLLQLSNYAFDGATFDFYAALTNGLALCIPDKDTLLDPAALARFVQRHAANVTFITTALFNRMVDETPDLPGRFRRMFFGGQEASMPHVRRALAQMAPGALVHVYGPTECTTFATWHTVQPADLGEHAQRLPIGRPIAHTSVYLLDPRQMPVPPGVPGELYIGGQGLAAGYLGQPGLTAQFFIASPFADELLYRTGDLCVQRADGAIEFLGRLDGQVKVRGFRIELGEVEHHIATHPQVEGVHVMPRKNDSGNVELVAYLTTRGTGAGPDLGELMAHMALSLPRYMLPAHFVLLDALPLNRNGKVDRAALPAPEAGAMSIQSVVDGAVLNAEERTLLQAWQAVLGREAIGLHDNYYAIGGDSIQAIQIVSRLRNLGLALKVTDLLRYPTIAQLAPLMVRSQAQKTRLASTGEAIALTPIQHWMFERQLPAVQHFNQSVLLRLPPAGDAHRMERALAALEERHEALRLRFGIDASGAAWQMTAAASAAPLVVHSFSGPGALGQMHAEINHLQRGFVPAGAPLWKAALLRLDDGDRLLLTIHHWAVDGVSWHIILEDLASAYAQAADPAAQIRLAQPSASFHDWSLALQAAAANSHFAGQADYWRHQMARDVGTLPLLAKAAPARLDERLVLSFTLGEQQSADLFGACHDAYRTRSDELLLTAWVHALGLAQGHPACRVVLESHGREALSESVDVSRTVGWFTAIYPLVFAIDGKGWSSQIRQVKETLRGVPDHGIGYGLLRYLGQAAGLSGPAGEVVFNYLGRFDHREQPLPMAAESTGDELDPAIRMEQGLDVSAELRDGVLRVRLVADTARHPEAFFHTLCASFEQALADIVAHCLSSEAGALSPSDVDLEGIGIDDLDNILDSLEGF